MKLLNFSIFSICAVISAASGAVIADNDSSAIDSRSMTRAVESSTGVVLRVPIDQAGRELPSATELRLVKGADSSPAAADFPTLWTAGVDSTTAPQLDSSTDSGDSSTWGWNRWNNYNGWTNNYYSNWYYPTYCNYGNYYNYGYYNSYNYYQPAYYNGYNYWGYRYYYYNRY